MADRLRPLARLVDVVQVDAGERHGELTEGVEPGLVGAPVEALAPIVEQLAQVGDAGPGGPRGAGRLVGQPRAREALAQVVQDAIRDRELVRSC
jgi:hypothetical protein